MSYVTIDEFDIKKLKIIPSRGDKLWGNLKYNYTDEDGKTYYDNFYLCLNNLKLVYPGVSKYNPDAFKNSKFKLSEYADQRFRFTILNDLKIKKVFDAIDNELKKFKDDNMKQLEESEDKTLRYYPIVEKPTKLEKKQKAIQKYKELNKDTKLTDEEILELSTTTKFKLIHHDETPSKDTEIDCDITCDEKIDLQCECQNLDFFINTFKPGTEVSIIINMSSWWIQSSLTFGWGIRRFISNIFIHKLSNYGKKVLVFKNDKIFNTGKKLVSKKVNYDENEEESEEENEQSPKEIKKIQRNKKHDDDEDEEEPKESKKIQKRGVKKQEENKIKFDKKTLKTVNKYSRNEQIDDEYDDEYDEDESTDE